VRKDTVVPKRFRGVIANLIDAEKMTAGTQPSRVPCPCVAQHLVQPTRRSGRPIFFAENVQGCLRLMLILSFVMTTFNLLKENGHIFVRDTLEN
jgi:hypothetical protein